MQKPEIIVIIGPTASGKSALAVRLAKKLNGEIISADSRQVYRDLDIGTAKITKKEMRGIPHHLLNMASPRHIYTVMDFKNSAKQKIDEIQKRRHIPIVVGGTAFWINALIYDLRLPIVSPNPALRRILEKKSVAQLAAILKKQDTARFKNIDQKNPRRLIRAIEIAKALGEVPRLKQQSPYQAYWIGINPPAPVLHTKISMRAAHMIRNGLIRETKQLLQKHISKKRIHELGFEYSITLGYIKKKINRVQLRDQLVHATMQYTKRQMTWWKKNKEIHWITSENISQLLNSFTIPVKRHEK